MAYNTPPYIVTKTIPPAVTSFLATRGWTPFWTGPDQLYQHHTKYPSLYFEWSEAISMELVEFMTLGNSRDA